MKIPKNKEKEKSKNEEKRISRNEADLLSLAVYCFFPAAHRHFGQFWGSYRINSHYIMKKNDKIWINCGSGPEYLWICVQKDKNDEEIELMPDDDTMFVTGWCKPIYKTMSLEMDNKKPVFCRINHGMPEYLLKLTHYKISKFITGPYLNSTNIIKEFQEECLTNLSHFSAAHCLVRDTDQGSPAFTTRSNDRKTSRKFDYVLCVPVLYHNNVRNAFLSRMKKDKWPLNSIPNLDKLLTDNLYVVPKPDPNSVTGDLRWRLSFSVIEVELARTLTDIQRRCYRVLKAMIKFDVNEDLPEDMKFPSYFLKTVMFWHCEESSGTSWTFQNLAQNWCNLMDRVIKRLENNFLPHYFVPSYNLLDEKQSKLPKYFLPSHENASSVIQCWTTRLKQVKEKPFEAFKKFWSRYTIDEMSEEFGKDMYCCMIDNINQISYHQQTKIHSSKITECIFNMRNVTINYLLSIYSLADFLTFLEHTSNPGTNKFGHSPSKEHLVWHCYIKYFKDTTEWWSSLAEVSHHIVLKYGEDNELLTIKKAEQFHLMACFRQEKRYINTAPFIKYANFLRAETRFEESVNVLIRLLQLEHLSDHLCYFSRVMLAVLDDCFLLETALQDEVGPVQRFLVYHLLTCCYIKKRVLAEVCIPEYVHLPVINGEVDKPSNADLKLLSEVDQTKDPSSSNVIKTMLLGYQYILCGQLLQALYCFIKVPDEVPVDSVIPYSTKYAAMIYTIAKLANTKNQRQKHILSKL